MTAFLTKIDPSKNMCRFYRLSIERTLFGEYALVREWGRVGATRGRVKEDWHASALDADAAMLSALAKRLRRGYEHSGYAAAPE